MAGGCHPRMWKRWRGKCEGENVQSPSCTPVICFSTQELPIDFPEEKQDREPNKTHIEHPEAATVMAEWHEGLWNNGPDVRASATPVCAAKEKFRLHIGGEWLALCRHSCAQPNAAALSQGEMPAFRICYGVRHPSLPPGHTSVWQQQWNPGVSPWKFWFVWFYHCGNNLLFSRTRTLTMYLS